MRSKPRAKDDGFNLVVLAMAVTVLNILVAAALPAWSKIIQREKEAELIFRGLQYAEAIRVYQQNHNGAFPNSLRALTDEQPRSIRQLWKNPLAEDGAWLLLPAQAGRPGGNPGQQANPGAQGGNPNNPNNPSRGRNGAENQGSGNGRNPRGNQPVQQAALTAVRVVPTAPGEVDFSTPQVTLPFMGVASPEGETAALMFMGSNEIQEWRFTVDLLRPQQRMHEAFARPVHSSVFWKPWPPGVNPLQQQQRNALGGDPTRRGMQSAPRGTNRNDR